MMKIVLYSNFLNHHQLPLAEAFNRINGVEYVFVANTPFDLERSSMGYEDMNRKYDFVVRAYESRDSERLAHRLAQEADIVMVGDSPLSYMMERLNNGKVTFRAGERLFKNGTDLPHLPKNIGRIIKHKLIQCQRKPLFFLAMSSHLSYDMNLFTKYPDRTFKWAYFTEIKKLDFDLLASARLAHQTIRILWIGRLLRLKHPDAVVRLAVRLRDAGYRFECNFFGEGEMEKEIHALIDRNHLNDSVHLHGFISREEVRQQMEQADIFLFTSDTREGWGAVLNEAMNSGCAVVSSDACGAARFLIQDGINGFVYRYGDENEMCRKIELLLKDQPLRFSFSKNAFETMVHLWNAETAADRLIHLSEILNEITMADLVCTPEQWGKNTIKGIRNPLDLYLDGPCSPAAIEEGSH